MNEKITIDLYNFYSMVFRVAVSNKNLDDVRKYFEKYAKPFFAEQNFERALNYMWSFVAGLRDCLLAMVDLSLMFAQ